MADFNPFTASFIASPESKSPPTNWQPYLPDFPFISSSPSLSPPPRIIREQTLDTPLVVQPPKTDFLYTYLAYQAAAAAIAAAATNPPVQQQQQQQQNVSIHKSSPTSETIYPWMRDVKRTTQFQQQTTSLVQQHQQSGGHYTSLVLTPSDSNHQLASPLSPQPTPPISLSPGKNINKIKIVYLFF